MFAFLQMSYSQQERQQPLDYKVYSTLQMKPHLGCVEHSVEKGR